MMDLASAFADDADWESCDFSGAVEHGMAQESPPYWLRNGCPVDDFGPVDDGAPVDDDLPF